ncbi:hypothetical protein ACHAW6_012868 [Cyclotella cf. meneghiniana]
MFTDYPCDETRMSSYTDNGSANKAAAAADAARNMNREDDMAENAEDLSVDDLSNSHRSSDHEQEPKGSFEDLFDKYAARASPNEDKHRSIISTSNPEKDHKSSFRRRVSYGGNSSSELDDVPDFHVRRKSCVSELSTQTEEKHASGSKGSLSRRGSMSSVGFVEGIWSRLQRKNEVWELESSISGDEDEYRSLADCLINYFSSTGLWVSSTLKTAFTTKSVSIPCILFLVAVSVGGILIIGSFESVESNSRKKEAVFVAEQADQFFVRTLERAFVPLFSIAQFVRELDDFHRLDIDIGDRCDPLTDEFNCTLSDSAPVKEGNETTHRDLTKLFHTEYGMRIQKKFDSIARGIKANSGLGKSLVNIQLAPKGVVSLIYPMVNCEDFNNGWCLNNTSAWGHDLLNDPERVAIAEATVPADGVVTAGPLPLIQGGDTFIARLAINIEGGNHSMVINDVDYPCWGFAVVLIDWTRLKEESDIYKDFASKHMQFKLTRTDIIDDEEVVKTIAESSRSYLLADENVTLELNASDNGWVVSVGYDTGFSPNYKKWTYPLIFFSAVVFTMLLMLVLVSRKQHEELLSKMLPKRAIKKLRRGQTVVERYKMVSIFFSDIVGYTEMSSEMTPTEVMNMLNDLYTKFDALAEKHLVYKLETIGDAYIAIGGAPNVCNGPEAAERVTLFALDAIKVAESYRTNGGAQVFIRAGIASGPVVAGVVGSSLPKYTVFGDTVNFAARMEQTSAKMRLQISPSTQRMLLDAPNYDFEFEDRYDDNGELGVELKGKGRQYTYWVNSAKKLVTGSSESTEKEPVSLEFIETDDFEKA